MANSKRRYFGWKMVLDLSGGNITAFLELMGEIWDTAAKEGINPLNGERIHPTIQSAAIQDASHKWAYRDKNEQHGGSRRFVAIAQIGGAIHMYLKRDLALSNPGHSGFSLKESEMIGSNSRDEVRQFLQNAVSWAIMEERTHTSKMSDGAIRSKWYLHPMLSPEYVLPVTRVKEPLYVNVEQVHTWLFGGETVVFGPKKQSGDRALSMDGRILEKEQLHLDMAEGLSDETPMG
jgi:hypothetical protein